MARRLSFTESDELKAYFWARVHVADADACWPWAKCLNSSGYGGLKISGRSYASNQLALILSGFPRPDKDNHALHSCDFPACCNPAHLRWGSHQENMKDRTARGRGVQRVARGEKAPFVKLTEAQARFALSSDKQGQDIAAMFGVHKATISDIRTRKTWRHL